MPVEAALPSVDAPPFGEAPAAEASDVVADDVVTDDAVDDETADDDRDGGVVPTSEEPEVEGPLPCLGLGCDSADVVPVARCPSGASVMVYSRS